MEDTRRKVGICTTPRTGTCLCLIEKTERVTVTVQSNLAAWEDAEGIWYVLNLRCWKDSKTELPMRHLELRESLPNSEGEREERFRVGSRLHEGDY